MSDMCQTEPLIQFYRTFNWWITPYLCSAANNLVTYKEVNAQVKTG